MKIRILLYVIIKKTDPFHFQCQFKGSGEIKFKEQFLKGFAEIYKIKEFDSEQTAKKCSDDDNEEKIEKMLASSFYFLNKILIIIGLLLY